MEGYDSRFKSCVNSTYLPLKVVNDIFSFYSSTKLIRKSKLDTAKPPHQKKVSLPGGLSGPSARNLFK